MRPLAAVLVALSMATAWSAELAFKKEGKGPGVVLIHGFGVNRTVWADQVTRMKKDHTVLTVDLPGHGDSATPVHSAMADHPSSHVWRVICVRLGSARRSASERLIGRATSPPTSSR